MCDIQGFIQGCSQSAIIILMVILMVVGAAVLAAHWMIFKKAGRRGWTCLVPFYSTYAFYSIVWGNSWIFLIAIALSFITLNTSGFICWIFLIIDFAFCCIHQYKTAKSFGRGIGFAAGLLLLFPVFICILGFCNYGYIGPSGKKIRNSDDDD